MVACWCWALLLLATGTMTGLDGLFVLFWAGFAFVVWLIWRKKRG
jgi:hypothetical protein